MITLTRASVRFGEVTALDDFTGSFPSGTVTALIGGDGAGKSTLLKALAGRVPVSPPQSPAASDRREIGYQPADSGVWRNLSVEENVEFVRRVYGLRAPRHRDRAEELLRRAGLEHARDRVAGRLSGGMRQKLGFVLATIHEPGLVLLDEPTTGVDPVSRGELWTLIAGAAADGATVVFATTYLDEAERATRLFLLGGGKLLATGTPEDVVSRIPGTMWQAPADHAHPEPGRARHAWRRATTTYLWMPEQDSPAPAGFAPSAPDLENASIALLLAAEDRDSPGPATPADAAGTTEPPQDIRTPGPIAAETAHLVRATDVVRRYGSFTALHGVSLTVAPGEIVGLLGGNGAGKTTLMRILLGLETPSSGACTLFGDRPSLDTRRRIGYVAQGLGLYPSLSAIENLTFAASVHGVEISEPSMAFARDLGSAPVAALPLGTQRVLAYLAASQHRPELLILDEPTSGMDALTRARLWRDLRDTADQGAGLLVTTHYMQEAAQCDRLVILTAGEVTGAGTTDEITAGRTSLVIRSGTWQEAFGLLREAGLPVTLDGRTLRLPGVPRGAAEAALERIADEVRISESRSTLEETMMLAALARSSSRLRM